MAAAESQGEGVPITREMMGIAKRVDGQFVTRAIAPGRLHEQNRAFALAASPPVVAGKRATHPGYALSKLVLRCWAVGVPVWGADVAYDGYIVPYDYSSHMRGKRNTHQFEHTEARGESIPCKGHGLASCDAIAPSLGDGVRRWRHDGEPGPAEADVPSLARRRLNEVTEYLRGHGQGEANIRATPSIAQVVELLDALPDVVPRERRYWALLANPEYYQIEEAVRELDEDWWTAGRSALFPGDRIVVWKARGRGEQRGIVALGTVLTEPQVRSDDPDNPYWLDPERGQRSARRVLVRYEHADNLPLWADEPGNAILEELSVSGSRGGSVFHVTREQWAAIALRAELTTEHDSDETTRTRRETHRVGSAYREAVELRAMEEAKRYFRERGWYLGPEGDVSEQRGLGYDLLFTRGTEELHVEAKGTSGNGAVVTLTSNEVDHAREYSNFALFVLSDIAVSQSDDGKFTATDGQERVLAPLRLDDEGALWPSQYSYRLPKRD